MNTPISSSITIRSGVLQVANRQYLVVPGGIGNGSRAEFMRKKYFPAEPTGKNDPEARLFSGLRRYDITLADRRIIETEHGFTEAWTGGHYQYRTSSFWRHLANVYYDGKYTFVGRYMDLEAV